MIRHVFQCQFCGWHCNVKAWIWGAMQVSHHYKEAHNKLMPYSVKAPALVRQGPPKYFKR